jgi:hypothetical protein
MTTHRVARSVGVSHHRARRVPSIVILKLNGSECYAKTIFRNFRSMPAERISVAPNGFDTEVMAPDPAAGSAQRAAWGLPERAFVIGCVAHLDPMKGH